MGTRRTASKYPRPYPAIQTGLVPYPSFHGYTGSYPSPYRRRRWQPIYDGGGLPAEAASAYVSLIQRLLNRFLGLDLPVDGVMNVDTRSALRSFENQGDPSAGNDGAPGGQGPAPFGQPDQPDQPDQPGQSDQPGEPGQSGEPDQPAGDTDSAQEEYGYF